MRVVSNLVFTVLAIVNSIGMASGMPPKTLDLLENFGRRSKHSQNQEISSGMEILPDGLPILRDLRAEPTPPTERQNLPASFQLDARIHLPISSSPYAEAPLCSRSRSSLAMSRTPPTKLPFSNVLGFGLDQLESIRLIPFKNPIRLFELRKFTFPVNKALELLEAPNKYGPIPNQEKIVLSTFVGEVFAILDGSDNLSGIYTYDSSAHDKVRAKVSMRNGTVTPLTAEEIKDTPVGSRRRLSYSYRVEHVTNSHGSLGSTSSSPSGHMTVPTRLPSSDGSACELDQLQFIRLIPNKNQNQIFKLQRYTFPIEKRIFVYHGANRYLPIPIQELIVLTTPAGDVFAILETSSILAGIYTYNSSNSAKERVKMNIRSRKVIQLTKREISEVPVGRLRPILLNFKIQNIHLNPPRHSIS